MAVIAKNKQSVPYAVLHTPIVLQPAGQADSTVNVTSEVKALTPAQRVSWQADQIAGKVFFCKGAADVEIDFDDLTIYSDTNVIDDSKTPRAAQQTPSSAIYFDTQGQPQRTFIISDQGGAFELEFWGSIDVVNGDLAAKEYLFLGKMSAADPGTYSVPDEILDKLRRYRFIKVDAIRGVPPAVNFQSSF